MGALDFHSDKQHLPLAIDVPPSEEMLWERWRGQGDTNARAALLDIHLPYARVVAASYYGKRFHDEIEFDEYLQLASLGLIEAMERFDPARGVQFRTFASRRMHGSIVDGIERTTEKQQQIAARQRIETQRQLSIAEPDEGGTDGGQPTAAARTTEQLLQYVAEAGLAFALSWILDGSGMVDADEKVETMPFYRSVELKQLRQRIFDVVAALPTQERTVIHSHYIQELPFEEVATRLGVTRGRVSQVHKRALFRLRQALREPGTCNVLA